MDYAELSMWTSNNARQVRNDTIHTVGSLIEELQKLDPQLPVVFKVNPDLYGGLAGVRHKEDMF